MATLIGNELDHSSNIDKLLKDEIFSKTPYAGLARILPYTSVRTLEPGETLYRKGQKAEAFYYLMEGAVKLISDRHEVASDNRRLGQEAATDFADYLTDAVAQTRATVFVIPRASMGALFASLPKLRSEFYLSLLHTFSGDLLQGEPVEEQVAKAEKSPPENDPAVTYPNLIGWILTVVAPILIINFGQSWGIEKNALYFLAIFSSTVVMWVFSLVDEFIPGVFAILATLAMQLVPMSVILSGLASDGFMMAMSVLGLSAVIVASGLSYRILLLVLCKLPNTAFWQNSALLSIGFLLTPLIPSINGRVALVTPFLTDMLEILRQKSKGLAANRLAVSAFTGVSLLSGVFISSKSVNFVIFGLLPDQIQDQFQFVSWLVASAATGGILLVLYFLLAGLMFRGKETTLLSREQLKVQLSLIGKMKNREWAAITGVALFMVGVLTISMHKIASPWIGMAILFGLLLFGALNKNEFREKIDWPFLIYLGGIVGITSAMNHLGLGQVIANSLPWLGEYMHTNFSLFVLILAGVIFLIRLAVPISATIVILATVMMPVAVHYGVNPWVVGFVILILGEMWFFPYQCSYYLQFRQLTKGSVYDEKVFLKFNALSNLTKVAAIYASMPYWKSMGLL